MKRWGGGKRWGCDVFGFVPYWCLTYCLKPNSPNEMQILEPLRSQWARSLGCDCKASTGSVSRSGGQVHLKGFLVSKWSCDVSTILFLLCVLHALRWPPQLSLSPWRKLAQTYQRCSESAISNSQDPALAGFSSCRRGSLGPSFLLPLPTNYFCQSRKWRVDLPTHSQPSSAGCASLFTGSEVWVGHPRVDGSYNVLVCLPAAMQFESMMVLQCFCNRLCGSSCWLPRGQRKIYHWRLA